MKTEKGRDGFQEQYTQDRANKQQLRKICDVIQKPTTKIIQPIILRCVTILTNQNTHQLYDKKQHSQLTFITATQSQI